MPDLQSELKKVKAVQSLDNLKFDDGDEDMPPATEAKKSMTNMVFDYYVAHPMSTTNECADALEMDRSRVAALSLQLLSRKLLSRLKRGNDLYRYGATTNVFPNAVELRKAALIKAREIRKANPTPPKVKVVKRKDETFTESAVFDAAKLVNKLSPFEAKALYDELKRLFGG